VSGDVFYVDDAPNAGDTPKTSVRPNPYNEHVTFHDFDEEGPLAFPASCGGANLFFVEDVGYQKAAIQEMERAHCCPVIPMKPHDRQAQRVLQVVAPYIKNGTVLFPRARVRGAAWADIQSRRGVA
jgi:hypothetical protein